MAFGSSSHTFVVCAYGESPYLAECLASLAIQDTRTKVIVCTATPNDFISDAAAAYGFELHVNPNPPSIGGDWNFGLSRVRTPLATVAHQDDIYLPSYAHDMLEAMSSARDPLLYFTDYGELRDEGVVLDNRLLNIKRLMLRPMGLPNAENSRFVRRRILSLGSAICCPSVTLNLYRVGRPVFDENMHCSLDWDAWERISKMRGAYVYDPRPQMLHRIHAESETTRLIQDNTRSNEDLAILNRFWPAPLAALIGKVYFTSQNSNAVGKAETKRRGIRGSLGRKAS